jgi:putative FmdB family regulatory protein
MPIYEYRCDNGHTIEAFQSMSDESLDACEVCGAPAQRVLHAPAVHFKGSGFYTTDYARKGAKKGVSDGSSPDSGSEKKSESGGDAKKSDSGPKTDSSSKPDRKAKAAKD